MTAAWYVAWLDTGEHYSDSEITKIYGIGAVRSNAHLREDDAYGIKLPAGGSYQLNQDIYGSRIETNSLVIGAAFYFTALPTSDSPLMGGGPIEILGSAARYHHVRLNADGSLSITEAWGGPYRTELFRTTAGLISAGRHYYLEYADYDLDGRGSRGLLLAVNGETLFYASVAGEKCRYVWFDAPDGVDMYLSGIYILGGSSGKPTLLGPVWVRACVPTSDGGYTEWTPSSGDSHYALVDEIPPSDTDKLTCPTTAVTKKDSFGFATLEDTDTPAAIFLSARFNGIGNIFSIAPDSTETEGQPGNFSTSIYTESVGRGWLTLPASGMPLTVAEINGYQFGVESSYSGAFLSQVILLVAFSIPAPAEPGLRIAQQVIEIAIPYPGDESYVSLQEWLQEDRERLLLFEIEWHDGHEIQTEYVSNLGYVTYPGDIPEDQSYPDLVVSVPTLSMQLDQPTQIGAVTILNQALTPTSTGPYDSWHDKDVVGHEIRCYIGDRSWHRNLFQMFFRGIVKSVSFDARGNLVLDISDRSGLLDKMTTYQAVYGNAFNCEPYYIGPDPIYTIDQVPNSTVYQILDCRDNGIDVAYTPADNNRQFSLSASPAGRVTFDVEKQEDCSAGAVIQNLVLDSGLAVGDMDLTSLDLATLTVGYYVAKDQKDSFLDLINQCAHASGGYVHFDYQGILRYYTLDIVDLPTVTLGVDDMVSGVALTNIQDPAKSVRLSVRKNFSVQDADSLAGAVTDELRQTFSVPYTYCTASNGLDPNVYPAADDVAIDTLLSYVSEGNTESARRASVRATRNITAQLTLPYLAVFLQLGEPVILDYPRYGFSGGHTAVVIGLDFRPDDNQTILTLWMPL